MCGQPSHNTPPHARLQHILLGVDASYDLTTERSFDSQATWVIDVLGISIWHVIHGFLYNQALADVRSTGAGIKCLYCMTLQKLLVSTQATLYLLF